MTEEFLDLDEVAIALRVSISVWSTRLRQSLLHDELSVPELLALGRLDRDGPSTVSDLARAGQLTPQSLASTVAQLEARGFIARNPDPTDGRRVLRSVTEAGREALSHERSGATRLLAKVLADDFSREEVEILRAAAPLIDRLGECTAKSTHGKPSSRHAGGPAQRRDQT